MKPQVMREAAATIVALASELAARDEQVRIFRAHVLGTRA